MMVRAKRLGWDEVLTPEQLLDHDPYDYETDDIEGELAIRHIPGNDWHKPFTLYLVGVHSADPKPITAVNPGHDEFRKLPTKDLVASLKPGQGRAFKTRPDGTMLDDHTVSRCCASAASLRKLMEQIRNRMPPPAIQKPLLLSTLPDTTQEPSD
jgi:hypothetical protein